MATAQPKPKKPTAPLPISPTWLPRVQAFRNQFSLQDPGWEKTERLKTDISTHCTQNPGTGLSRPLFDRIVSWKLETQEKRTSHYRLKVTDDLVDKITTCAFGLDHQDRNVLAEVRLHTLSALPGVNIGIASAILALTFPDKYGVIDPRVWKMIYGVAHKGGFSIPDYTMYLGHLLDGATQLKWTAQELDFFTWRL